MLRQKDTEMTVLERETFLHPPDPEKQEAEHTGEGHVGKHQGLGRQREE